MLYKWTLLGICNDIESKISRDFYIVAKSGSSSTSKVKMLIKALLKVKHIERHYDIKYSDVYKYGYIIDRYDNE